MSSLVTSNRDNTQRETQGDIDTEDESKFVTPSEHLAKIVQSIPFEVVKYEKNQVKDAIIKSYVDSQIKKHLLEAKYRNLENRINFIQLSIIFLSAVATFLQAIKDQINMNTLLGEIIYIFISSYTALLLSISRFLKWETQKEEISKLIVNYAHVINKMRHQLRRIQNIDIELREKSWDDILKELSKDNIESDITKFNTQLDTILNASEKVYYQNKLQHIKVKGFINSKYDIMLNTISSKEHINRIHISPYKRSSVFCCRVKYDTSRFLKDMESIVDNIQYKKRMMRMKEERSLQSKIENDYLVKFDEPPPSLVPQDMTQSYVPIQSNPPVQSHTRDYSRRSHSVVPAIVRNISLEQGSHSPIQSVVHSVAQSAIHPVSRSSPLPSITKSMTFIRKDKHVNTSSVESVPESIVENIQNDTNNSTTSSIGSVQRRNDVINEPEDEHHEQQDREHKQEDEDEQQDHEQQEKSNENKQVRIALDIEDRI
jgi:hypothetical protein